MSTPNTYRIMLTPAQILHHADYAPTACAYWTSEEKLPSRAKLTQALSKGLCFTPFQLVLISHEDRFSTDTIVQVALFGELRYG